MHPHHPGNDTPSPWVTRFAAGLAPGRRVLDLACGSGRHTRWCLAAGHRVTAVDRDLGGLAGLVDPNLEQVAVDLEDGSPWAFARVPFDLVLVTRYLHRPSLPAILAAVAPGGRLIYETFAVGNERFGRPRRPAFLLEPDELLVACAELRVLAFEQGTVRDPEPAVLQRICAVRELSTNSDRSIALLPDIPPDR